MNSRAQTDLEATPRPGGGRARRRRALAGAGWLLAWLVAAGPGGGFRAAGAVGARAPAGARPNIVFIFTDDHSLQTIGAYDTWLSGFCRKQGVTPNIDRLAARGGLFVNSFCGNSLCSPSRASILTGLHSHANGVRNLGETVRAGVWTFPAAMREAGYQTAVIGKWHLGRTPAGTDHWRLLDGQGTYWHPEFTGPDGVEKRPGYATDVITDLSLDWLRGRDRTRPFLLMIQHKAPHRSWMPPPRYYSWLSKVTVPEPATLFDDHAGRASPARNQKMEIGRIMTMDGDLKVLEPGRWVQEFNRMTDAERAEWSAAFGPRNETFRQAGLSGTNLTRWKYQEYMKDYLRCIKAVDDGVGRVLDWLKAEGLEDNTAVIYASDQGFFNGEHGWFDKRWIYEESIHMPFIIRWPGVVKPGTRFQPFIQNIDYAPTLVEMAGGRVPDGLHGRSFLPVLRGATPPDWRRSVYYQYYDAGHGVPPHHGLRDERYTLARFVETGEWELFDNRRDPLQLRSVHDDPAYAATFASLRQELDRLRALYQDTNDVVAPMVPVPDRMAFLAARVADGCRSIERTVLGGGPQPSLRQVTSAALGLLELGEPAARAERLARHALALQDMDPASPGYGTVPWQEGRPELRDPNAIEFTLQPLAVMLLRHGPALSASFRRDVRPHLRAALAAIRRHDVPARYANIHLMKLGNLLLIGQALGDASAVAEGRAGFDAWLAHVRANGLGEYASPTYSPIQADTLGLASRLADDLGLRARLRLALEFVWTDLAAAYFPARQTMTGPASRNYNNGFLRSDANAETFFYLAGLRSAPPADTIFSDTLRAWVAARVGAQPPPSEILAIGRQPERVVRSRFGPEPGQDRYLWITPAIALGSVSAYHGPQDRRLCAEFGADRPLPLIQLVVDGLDAPYGLVRSTDRGGHSKPHHLPHRLASVQEKGFLLSLVDLSPAFAGREFTNLASNVILPWHADQLVLDGQLLGAGAEATATDSPFPPPVRRAAGPGSVVGVRHGRAAVAIRIFAADGAGGQEPAWSVQGGGAEAGAAAANAGAGRLAVHHYRGPARSLAGATVRCGVLMLAAPCDSDAAFDALLRRARDLRLEQEVRDGVWSVTAVSESVTLEAGLDLGRQAIAHRRVNGRAVEAGLLTVNDRDVATRTLGATAPAPGPAPAPGR